MSVERTKKALKKLNQQLDWPLSLRTSLPPAPEVTTYGIYRARNSQVLLSALGRVSKASHIHLWALDEPSSLLEPWTRGSGPGKKFSLLNDLLSKHPPGSDAYVAILDDDFAWRRGDLARCLQLMVAAQVDLAQPTHSTHSFVNHGFTIKRPRARVRVTNFVEIGPAFLLSPAAVRTLLPYPHEAGMGWGLETVWMHQCAGRLRMGQLDEVTVDHLSPAGGAYSVALALAEQQALHRSVGLSDSDHPQETSDRWRAWRRRAPWVRRGTPWMAK